MQLNINFGDIKDTDPVMVISLRDAERMETIGQFFKKTGYEVWKLWGKDLGDNPCFHLAFPLPDDYSKLLGDLVHDLLHKEFKMSSSSTTWKRHAWNEVQTTYPMSLEVL